MKSNKYLKSPINYIGGKYNSLKYIIPLFPDKINTFVDLFGGSGTVILNVSAEHYVYNDINQYVKDILSGMSDMDLNDIIASIENIIKEYQLTKINKAGFEKLRDDYNNGKNDWITLYVLMSHSFNHQFRFNSKHQYNSSFGMNRSYFSERQRADLIEAKNRLLNMDISFLNHNFKEFDFSDFDENDFVYLDPPYFNSVGNYNDGKRGFEGWSIEHELLMKKLIEDLDDRNIKFALSNNIGFNTELEIWANKCGYKIHKINKSYSNCNYQKKDITEDIEVLITNY